MSDEDKPTDQSPESEGVEMLARGFLVDIEHRFSQKAEARMRARRLELTTARLRWGAVLETQGVTEAVLDALDTLYARDLEESNTRLEELAIAAQDLPERGIRFLLKRGLESAARSLKDADQIFD
jgi:hypothetical protein